MDEHQIKNKPALSYLRRVRKGLIYNTIEHVAQNGDGTWRYRIPSINIYGRYLGLVAHDSYVAKDWIAVMILCAEYWESSLSKHFSDVQSYIILDPESIGDSETRLIWDSEAWKSCFRFYRNFMGIHYPVAKSRSITSELGVKLPPRWKEVGFHTADYKNYGDDYYIREQWILGKNIDDWIRHAETIGCH